MLISGRRNGQITWMSRRGSEVDHLDDREGSSMGCLGAKQRRMEGYLDIRKDRAKHLQQERLGVDSSGIIVEADAAIMVYVQLATHQVCHTHTHICITNC